MHREVALTDLNKQLRGKKQSLNKDEIGRSRSWRNLITTILDQRVKRLASEQWGQTSPDLIVEPHLKEGLDFYSGFPFEFFSWNRTSRRVFQIPTSLEMPLAAAEFADDLVLSDLSWPHDSFILSLESPLQFIDKSGDSEQCDTLMFTRAKQSQGFMQYTIRGFYVSSGLSFEKLKASNTLKQRFCEHINNGHIAAADKTRLKFARLIQGDKKNILGQGSVVLSFDIGGGKIPINEIFTKIPKISNPLLSTALRLVFGWILYLEGMSSSRISVHGAKEKVSPSNMQNTLKLITSPDEIWSIHGRSNLNGLSHTRTSTQSTETGRFIRPHWRRGYYRRPPGSAPTAEKSVRVPAVLVREDLVPLYGLVGGTTSVIISR